MQIKAFAPQEVAQLEALFLDYCRELRLSEEDPRLTDTVLREKILQGLFLKHWQAGVVRIALAWEEDRPVGFSFYQVDGPDSDWNHRPGWGFFREFYVVPAARRRGVGRALAAFCRAQLGPVPGVYLTADTAAEGFWRACGFTDAGETAPNGNRIFGCTSGGPSG